MVGACQISIRGDSARGTSSSKLPSSGSGDAKFPFVELVVWIYDFVDVVDFVHVNFVFTNSFINIFRH